jgi:hypothetical protein
VLTTRSSGVTSASRLALDDVRLMTPRNLDGVLVRLLRHIADVRIPEADRDAWVAERAQRVRSITGAHKDMGSVPLLAVLGSWRNARPLLTKRPVAAADSGGHRPSLCPRCAHTGVVLTARCMLWGLLVSPGPSATPESAQEATVRDRCRSARVLRGFRWECHRCGERHSGALALGRTTLPSDERHSRPRSSRQRGIRSPCRLSPELTVDPTASRRLLCSSSGAAPSRRG